VNAPTAARITPDNQHHRPVMQNQKRPPRCRDGRSLPRYHPA